MKTTRRKTTSFALLCSSWCARFFLMNSEYSRVWEGKLAPFWDTKYGKEQHIANPLFENSSDTHQTNTHTAHKDYDPWYWVGYGAVSEMTDLTEIEQNSRVDSTNVPVFERFYWNGWCGWRNRNSKGHYSQSERSDWNFLKSSCNLNL